MAVDQLDRLATPIENGSAPHARLTHKAFLNAVSGVLDFGSTLIVGLFLTPILIRTLDSSLFGVWKILQQLVDYMSPADGRPGEALKWVIANQQTADDLAKRRSLTSAYLSYLIYLPFVLLIGAGLVWVSPSFAKVAPGFEIVVRITCGLLVLNFLLLSLAQLPAAALRGENQGYRRMGLAAGLTLLGAGLTVVAAWLNFGLVGIAAAQVLVGVGTGVFFLLIVKRYLPWWGFTRPTFAEVRAFLGLSNWFFVSVIVTRLLLGTDAVLLGFLTAPAMVTVYTVTNFASLTAIGLIGAVVGAIVPGLGVAISRGQCDRVGALSAEMMSYSWLLATVIGAGTLLLNRSFIHLWVGLDGRYAGATANLLIVLLSVQRVFQRNQSYILDLSLKLVPKVTLGLGAAAISIALAWLLIPSLGIVGLCLGLLVGRMVLTISLPILVDRYLGAARMSVRGLLRQAAIMCLLFGPALYFGERILLGNWLEFVTAAGGTAILCGGVCFLAGFSRAEQKLALRRTRLLTA